MTNITCPRVLFFSDRLTEHREQLVKEELTNCSLLLFPDFHADYALVAVRPFRRNTLASFLVRHSNYLQFGLWLWYDSWADVEGLSCNPIGRQDRRTESQKHAATRRRVTLAICRLAGLNRFH